MPLYDYRCFIFSHLDQFRAGLHKQRQLPVTVVARIESRVQLAQVFPYGSEECPTVILCRLFDSADNHLLPV